MNKIKFLLCFALLSSGVEGRGQIYINSYRFGGPTGDLLLDSFPSADAAYSFRKLDKDYTGDCIIVRRSSGTPSLDTIGFVGNYLDTAKLKTFCSGVNCFVREWYDQSGFGRNMKQATDANQPLIVSSGTLVKDGNFVALDFDGNNDKLQIDSVGPFDVMGALSFFAAIGEHTTNEENDFLGTRNSTSGKGFFYAFRLSFNRYIVNNLSAGNTIYTVSPFAKHLVAGIRNSSNVWDLYLNNVAGTQSGDYNNTAGTNAPLTIGADGNAGGFHDGKGMEYIFYKSNKGTDRTAIQTNINTFYSLY